MNNFTVEASVVRFGCFFEFVVKVIRDIFNRQCWHIGLLAPFGSIMVAKQLQVKAWL
jgi:hypothetical protein